MEWNGLRADQPDDEDSNQILNYWKGEKVLFLDSNVLASVSDDARAYARAYRVWNTQWNVVRGVTISAEDTMKAALLEREKTRFLAEYQHEELWEDHLKSAKTLHQTLNPTAPPWVASMAAFVVEHHWKDCCQLLDLEGGTFEAVRQLALRMGWQMPTDDEALAGSDVLPVNSTIEFKDWIRDAIAEFVVPSAKANP